MATRLPFILTHQAFRDYAGPSLVKPPTNLWTSEEQRNEPRRGLGLWAPAAAAGLFAFSRTNIGGKRGIDYLASFARGVEEYSPGGILRTFQASQMLSPYESVTRNANLFISPQLLEKNTVQSSYLAHLIGETPGSHTYERLVSEGVSLRGNVLYWGKEGTEVALGHAAAVRTSDVAGRSYIGASYAYGTGYVPPKGVSLEDFFRQVTVDKEAGIFNPTIEGQAVQIIGAQTRGQHRSRLANAYFTELMERPNRLLRHPFELGGLIEEGENWLQRKFGVRLNLPVERGTGAQVLGRLTKKYGLGLTTSILAYQTADHFYRRITGRTLFSTGADIFATIHVGVSQIAESLGLHRYREWQESVAPGSTDLTKLAAVPLTLAAGAGGLAYAYKVKKMAQLQLSEKMSAAVARHTVEESMAKWSIFGKIGDELAQELTTTRGYYARKDWVGKIFRSISSPNKEGELVYKFLGKLTPTKLATVAAAGAGIAAILPFLPGALIPGKRPDELREIYAGRKNVPIRKGRWWTFGRTPHEGGKIQYFRPHRTVLSRTRAREKAIWGRYDDLSPVSKFMMKNFTYGLENLHYYDRPYPISGLPFQDFPIIGPILGGTLGRLIKPPRYMHESEWRAGDGSQLVEPTEYGNFYATNLGEIPGGKAVSPYSIGNTFGEQFYRMTELVGLPGFMFETFKEKLTGSQGFFERREMASAGTIASTSRGFWDAELGDLFGSSEFIRRLYPNVRIKDQYNPIRNTMPGWLTGPNEGGPDFLHGDPYTRIGSGEVRLPGAGYEAIFPELEGTAAEQYPLIHKFRILADVAPYSEKFKQIKERVLAFRQGEDWTDYEEQIFKNTVQELKEKRETKKFYDYVYKDKGGYSAPSATASTNLIAAMNRVTADKRLKGKDDPISRLFGRTWETLSHGLDTPFEFLTPFSPMSKFMHTRSPVESYEKDIVFGTENAFWQHPLRDFVKPFLRSVTHAAGVNAIPGDLKKARAIQEHFDTLKYIKYTRLENLASKVGDEQGIKRFNELRRQTLFGINPFTRDYSQIYRALPAAERDYFEAFEKATSEEDRAKILAYVPENEKPFYLARWKLKYADDLRAAIKAGKLKGSNKSEAEREIAKVFKEAESEGFPRNPLLDFEFLMTRGKGETYADWYRREKILDNMPNLPGGDFIGYHPSVDLDDIKLKVAHEEGVDIHALGLWESQERELAYKPYLSGSVAEEAYRGGGPIDKTLARVRLRGRSYAAKLDSINRSKAEMTIEDTHFDEYERELRRMY